MNEVRASTAQLAGDIELRAHAWLEGRGVPGLHTAKQLSSDIIRRAQFGALDADEMIVALLGDLVARTVHREMLDVLK